LVLSASERRRGRLMGPPQILPPRPTGEVNLNKQPETVPKGLSSVLSQAPWVELRKLEWKPGFQIFLPDGSNFAVTVDGLRWVLEGLSVPGVDSILDYAWNFDEAVLDMHTFAVHAVFLRNRGIRENRVANSVAGGLR
jgi:hypothetical protein